MDTNTVQKEAASSGYTFYDPSDYTAEQAAEIAHAELQTVAKSEANERREYWERRGYMQPVDLGEFLRRDYKVEFLVDRCRAGSPRPSNCGFSGRCTKDVSRDELSQF